MTKQSHPYLCEYPFNGKKYGFEIWATSEEDAEARLKAIGWGKVSGRRLARVSVADGRRGPVSNAVASVVAWVLNHFGGRT